MFVILQVNVIKTRPVPTKLAGPTNFGAVPSWLKASNRTANDGEHLNTNLNQ
jgi:hypothetical protein